MINNKKCGVVVCVVAAYVSMVYAAEAERHSEYRAGLVPFSAVVPKFSVVDAERASHLGVDINEAEEGEERVIEEAFAKKRMERERDRRAAALAAQQLIERMEHETFSHSGLDVLCSAVECQAPKHKQEEAKKQPREEGKKAALVRVPRATVPQARPRGSHVDIDKVSAFLTFQWHQLNSCNPFAVLESSPY